MPSRPALIINADDLGIHPRINEGIFEAFERGILTSATMLVTTPFFEETVREARRRQLPVGIHLSLTLGTAIAPSEQLPQLVDGSGNLYRSARHFILAGRPTADQGCIYDQIRREFEAQMSLVRDAGLPVTHVDSHQHVHMNPHIFEIVESLADRYGISKIRFSREPFLGFALTTNLWTNLRRNNPSKLFLVRMLARRIRPRLRSSDHYFGLMCSGEITPQVFTMLIDHIAVSGGLYEVGIHPGYAVGPGERLYSDLDTDDFIRSSQREKELRLLIDPGVHALIENRGVRLMSFADL